jgi:hypothetical protein
MVGHEIYSYTLHTNGLNKLEEAVDALTVHPDTVLNQYGKACLLYTVVLQFSTISARHTPPSRPQALRVVKKLLDKGADPNFGITHHDKYGYNVSGIPMYRAVYYNHYDVVELFIKYGGNVNIGGYNELLFCSTGYSYFGGPNFKMTILLINNGANINGQVRKGKETLRQIFESHYSNELKFPQHYKQYQKDIQSIHTLLKFGPEAALRDIEMERLEKERLEKERLEKERLERERIEKARLERERLAREQKERIERERIERERIAKIEADKLEKERIEREKEAQIEAERLAKERVKLECLAKIKAERLEKERVEQERLAKIEAERLEKERIEQEIIQKNNEDQAYFYVMKANLSKCREYYENLPNNYLEYNIGLLREIIGMINFPKKEDINEIEQGIEFLERQLTRNDEVGMDSVSKDKMGGAYFVLAITNIKTISEVNDKLDEKFVNYIYSFTSSLFEMANDNMNKESKEKVRMDLDEELKKYIT